MQRGHALIPPGRRYAFLADRAVTFHFARITNQAIKEKTVARTTVFIRKTRKELMYLTPTHGFRIRKPTDFVNGFRLAPSQRGNVSAKERAKND